MPRKKNNVTKNKRHDADVLDASYDHHESEESRTVYLVGDIDEGTIKTTVEKIVALSERDAKKPIYLIINTFGGEVDDAFMLYDLMKYIQTPIHTIGLGKIMSAGCLLLAAGEKGHRKIGANARVMYHCGWERHVGNVFEMRAELEAFEKLEQQYDQRFADETGMTIQQVEDLYDKNGPTRNHYITAVEAKKLGIVDEII